MKAVLTECARRVQSRCLSILPCLALFFVAPALADTATLTLGSATKGTSSTPVTMRFPVTRAGDPGYDAVVRYHTVDGTALAGTDYTAASGLITISAGPSGGTIPVTLAANTSNAAALTFQLIADAVIGVGPAAALSAQQAFATGTNPNAVTTADINGDGKADLIVANTNDNTVSVLLNITAPGAATPSFAAQQVFATGNVPVSVATADVNGDGKADLILVNSNDNTVSVLLNTTAPGASAPSFATQQTFATGTIPEFVTAADINGDGKADLIVANSNDATVSVLFNTTAAGAATPTFATQQTFATGSSPVATVAADVNGDGKSDLIVANADSATLSVLLNTTLPGAVAPSFAAQQTFATGTNAFSVAAVDVNGDGKPDLIAANYLGNTISVLLNATAPGASAPSFTAQQSFATGSHPAYVTAADVNGDGKADLVVAGSGSANVSVLLNTATLGIAALSFSPQLAFATGLNPQSVTTADVNGDGRADLIVANGSDASVGVLLNTTAPGAGATSLATQQAFATGVDPISVAAADINGDGKPDLIVANYNAGTLSVLLNTTPTGSTTLSFATQVLFNVGSNPTSVATADINGDGLSDLIVANFTSNTVSVLLNTTVPGATTPSFAAHQPFATETFPNSVSVADINSDGLPDLITANINNNTVSVLLSTTAPGAATPSFSPEQAFTTGTGPVCVTAADVNGDGLVDLIATNRTDNTASVLLNTTTPGATTASFATQVAFATGLLPYFVTAADIDGDGRTDLVVSNVNANTLSVLLNTTPPGATTPSFAGQKVFATGVSPLAVAVADINGDGRPDLIAANFTVTAGSVSVLLSTQYQCSISGSAIGTIVHDYIFANGFE